MPDVTIDLQSNAPGPLDYKAMYEDAHIRQENQQREMELAMDRSRQDRAAYYDMRDRCKRVLDIAQGSWLSGFFWGLWSACILVFVLYQIARFW